MELPDTTAKAAAMCFKLDTAIIISVYNKEKLSTRACLRKQSKSRT